jgi:hypothetical protein
MVRGTSVTPAHDRALAARCRARQRAPAPLGSESARPRRAPAHAKELGPPDAGVPAVRMTRRRTGPSESRSTTTSGITPDHRVQLRGRQEPQIRVSSRPALREQRPRESLDVLCPDRVDFGPAESRRDVDSLHRLAVLAIGEPCARDLEASPQGVGASSTVRGRSASEQARGLPPRSWRQPLVQPARGSGRRPCRRRGAFRRGGFAGGPPGGANGRSGHPL